MFSVDARCVIGIKCLIVFLVTSSVQAQPRLEGGLLQDAVVRVGATVDFVCDLNGVSGYTIYWFYRRQGGFSRYLSVDRELSPPLPQQLAQRLSIIGNESRNEFNLRIGKVKESDEGMYSCKYAISERGATSEIAGTAELTVLVPPTPQSPWCSVVPAPAALGDDVTLDCNSQGGKPTPNITFYKGNEYVIGPASNTIRHEYQLQARDNGVLFTCTMTTPALDGSRSCSVMPLRILPTATILPAELSIEEDTAASFECNGEGVPSINNYSWKVIDASTGYALPPERYAVSGDNQTLEITVMGNLELVCIVRVPSGLSGNSTAMVKVTERIQTTVAEGLTASGRPQVYPNPTTESQFVSPVVPIAAVAAVVVLITVIAIIIFVRRKKQQEKPKIPVDSKDGSRMRDIEAEYDELTPGQGDRESGGRLAHEAGNQGSVNDAVVLSIAANSHSKPDTLAAKVNDGKQVQSTAACNQDALYAQPDKSKNARKVTADVTGTESEYSSVAMEEPEPAAADSGLMYADLDLHSPGTGTVDTVPVSTSEQTVYAMIRT